MLLIAVGDVAGFPEVAGGAFFGSIFETHVNFGEDSGSSHIRDEPIPRVRTTRQEIFLLQRRKIAIGMCA